jgi:excisionase family DNA binding protein
LDGPLCWPTVTVTRLLDTWNGNDSELGYASPSALHHVLQLWPGRAMTSESPGIETGQEGPGLHAERLAYSVDEVAHPTGLSRDLLYVLYDQMRCGNLHYVKIGRRRLITRQHLEQFLGLRSKTGDQVRSACSGQRT